MGDGLVATEPDDTRGAAAGRAHAAHRAALAAAAQPLAAMGNDILKAVALLNGGAAAATLALVSSALASERRLALPLVLPLAIFGFGLAVAAFATGWSYLAQAHAAQAVALRTTRPDPPYVEETEASREAARRGGRFQALAFAAVLAAMAAAVAGFLTAGAVLVLTLR